MRWLVLPAKFEPIPEFKYSLKKPLFAASVVLNVSPSVSRLSAELRIPIKGLLRYSIEVSTEQADEFLFGHIIERDEVKGTERVTSPSDFAFSESGLTVARRAPVMAHLQALPSFATCVTADEDVYGAYIVVGRKLQALRIERVRARVTGGAPASANDRASFVGKTMTVDEPLEERMFEALPWDARRGFEFDWSMANQMIKTARFHVPILGTIEIGS